jgi:hypothetical protein
MLCGKISITAPWLERETVSGLDIEESKMNGRAVAVKCSVSVPKRLMTREESQALA